MELGIRERLDFPEYYKGFRLLRCCGRIYGFPPFLEPDETFDDGKLLGHPATLRTATLEEMLAEIDHFDASRHEPQFVETYDGYDLVRHGSSHYGVPQSAGDVNLNREADRQRAGVLSGSCFEAVRERIRARRDAVPVEFAGWLPIFQFSGNCGTHPQFKHTASPPPGYHFTYSAPPEPSREKSLWVRAVRLWRAAVSRAQRGIVALFRPWFAILKPGPAGFAPRARLRVLASMLRLFLALRRMGARLFPALRFLQSRHFQSQVLLGNYRGLVFLTSMPYTYGQNPWVIEIEDPTTLFYPLIANGHTLDLRLTESPYFPIVKALLESEQCRGIVTHIRSTAELVPTLFRSDIIAKKLFYAPLGVRVPPRWQHHDEDQPEEIHLLFINSWCQIPENFYVRGGLDILEAFAILHERYPQLRLTLRTALPSLDDHYHRIIEKGWVRVINRFLSAEEMASLHADCHVFLLPAARVHIVSLLQAMSYGLAVVGSDGWGIEEYLEHERNGLVVKGRYGKASWADREAGVLREDYETMYTPSPEVVQGLVEAVSRLVEEPALRRRLGRAARQDVEQNYSLERWNQGLKEALDKALSIETPAEEPRAAIAAG
jgi:glycosyltransferase involved in cell wall biosynthesis